MPYIEMPRRVRIFPNVGTDEAQARKVLEEAGEVLEAWGIWDVLKDWSDFYDDFKREELVDECADVIQATTNLLFALGVKDATEAMKRCESRNEKRGRYSGCDGENGESPVFDEDAEALAWVRSHGGIAAVKAVWENEIPLALALTSELWPDGMPDDCTTEFIIGELHKRLMPDGYEWNHSFARAIEFFETMHDLLYTVDCEEEHDGPDMVQEVMRRLMPKGMEWPRFEDGEFVRSGDRLIDDNGDWFSAVSFIFTCDWWCIDGYRQIGFGTLSRETKRKLSGMPYGERVKRPAPKVLDADGVEIREKRDVWWICEGDERGVHAERLHVETICPNGLIECSPYNGGTWVNLEPSELYVNKPVPSSDGKPLREGERAYVATDGPSGSSLSTGDEVTVVIVGEDVTIVDDEGYEYIFTPDELTHERPDSWERLEDDATLPAATYCERMGIEVDEGYSFVEPMARDLVRRAKALAERGQ